MDENKQINRIVYIVYSTDELLDLQRRTEQAGGQIVRTNAIWTGEGISVEIEYFIK